jgi:hypothetical protein
MFDQASGQVFTEYAMSRGALAESDEDSAGWSRCRPYPSFTARGPHGPRPLVDMAISILADNIGKVRSGAHLETIPSNMLWRIWRYLEARSVSVADGAESLGPCKTDSLLEACVFMLGRFSPKFSWTTRMTKLLGCTAFDNIYAVLAPILPVTPSP